MAKREYKAYYTSVTDTDRLMSMDGWLISASKSSVANMPQEVKYHAWPSPGEYMEYNCNGDTVQGMNEQMNSDVRAAKRALGGVKY